jgi:pimeloyl-ACP methyl ester carboxylesterase
VEWVNWLRGRGVTSVFGLGESLGASILIQAVGAGAPFQAVVAECPYSSFEAIADQRVSRVVGGPLAWLLVREGVLYIRLRYSVNLERAATDTAIKRVHTPILLIHGLDDRKTSPQNSMRLARLNPAWTSLWLVPRAGHTGAYAQDPLAFEQKVLAHFD